VPADEGLSGGPAAETAAAANVTALWRYPFKSMLGGKHEELRLNQQGTIDDRRYALQELATHRLVSARHYPELLGFTAQVEGEKVQVTTPDGQTFSAEDEQFLQYANKHLNSKLTLVRAFDQRHPAGLFDDSPILIASEQTLQELQQRHADSDFDKRRFRANIWVSHLNGQPFAEETWLHKQFSIGDQVILQGEKLCERCVMTTHEQPELPRDYAILKTIVQTNNAVLGLYCRVVRGGTISLGDKLQIIP
jgi:uncharacterized protein